MSILIAYPLAALLVTAVFGVLWWWSGSALALINAVLWTKYAGYEYLMHARILCSGECNIRIDLLLIYPALLLFSLLALLHAVRSRKRFRSAA